MKGLGELVLGCIAGGLLGTAAFFAVDALIPKAADAQVSDETHQRCEKAADYKGCIGANNNFDAEEEVRTGILWDSAKWKNNNDTVRIKVYRQRGGGLWMGNSMRLSVMEVHCKSAEFDVQSDGYRQQSIEGDAFRQAPLIFARLCTKPQSVTEKL